MPARRRASSRGWTATLASSSASSSRPTPTRSRSPRPSAGGSGSSLPLGRALSELEGAIEKLNRPVGYEFSFGGQAQMMGEMKRTVLLVLAFVLFFSFIVLAVQFNSLKLHALILGSMPFALAGLVFLMLAAGLPLAIEEGGDMLKPMAAGAVGGLLMEGLAALFLMPCLYVVFTRRKEGADRRR